MQVLFIHVELLCSAALIVGISAGLPRPACRSDAATKCPPELAFFDRGHRDFWHQTYGVTWKTFPTADRTFFLRGMGLSDDQIDNVSTAALFTLEMIRLWEAYESPLSAVDLRDSKSGILEKELKVHYLKTAGVTASLTDGISYVFRLEQFNGGRDRPDLIMSPLFGLYHETSRLTGFASTGHIYITGKEGARTLTPHTDPYDVFVFQLVGSKNWTICTPQDAMLTEIFDAMGMSATDVDQFIRQAQIMGDFAETEHATPYNEATIADFGMRCSKFVLQAGESIYLPKGAIHYAVATAESVHFTSSLIRGRGVWIELLRYIAARLPDEMSPATTKPDTGSRALDHAQTASVGLYEALKIVEKQPHAVVFQKVLPYMPRIVGNGIDVVDVAVILHQIDRRFMMMKETLDILFKSDGGTPHEMALGIAFATEKINLAKLVREFATELANAESYCGITGCPGVGQGG